MRIVVQEWERVLLYRDGRLAEELGPGRHRRLRWRRRRVRLAVRPWLLTVPGQEVLTADGIAVKASLTATCRVAVPRAWHESVESPADFLYAALQSALRDAVGARTVEELLSDRAAVGEELRSAVGASTELVGAVVDAVVLRDVMLPGELRRAAVDVVAARAHGQAALERARGEVAATRALANAARAVADSPALLQLRVLQAVEAGGATVVLTPDGVVPAQR